MSYSYYEVYTNAQRAFSGLGFPYGADEDAAFIISWLEAFELSGIHLFANIQKRIDNNFDGTLTNKDFVNEINLEKNHDILSEVSERHNSAYIVGFAAETSNVNDNASKKLNSKNLNMIISNDVSDKTIGFDSDDNEVHVITENETIFLKKDKKIKIAREILNIIALNIKS